MCGKKNIDLGGAIDAHTDNPKFYCEDCAIDAYMKDHGFKTREAAEARRRRIFDVGYLFNEMITDKYIRQRNKKSIDDQVEEGLFRTGEEEEVAARPERREGRDETGPASADASGEEADRERDEKLFRRELHRLELSLSKLPSDADLTVAVVHYPPLSTDGIKTRAAHLIEEAGVRLCLFGHLHDVAPSPEPSLFGTWRGVDYRLTSCDYLEFTPLLVAEV